MLLALSIIVLQNLSLQPSVFHVKTDGCSELRSQLSCYILYFGTIPSKIPLLKIFVIQVLCHGLFKRPDIQEIADIVRFENDMVRAEAVCDTLAKPMSDVEKQHLRRVFHRAFGVHPRGKH